MAGQKKDPAEAARKAEERAKAAQAKHAKPEKPKAVSFTSEERLAALRDNEQGDAKLIIKALNGKYCFDKQRGKIFRFHGYWELDALGEGYKEANQVITAEYEKERRIQFKLSNDPKQPKEVRNSAAHFARKLEKRRDNLNTRRRMRSVMELACMGKHSLAITGEEWDVDLFGLQTLNALIDLRTGRDRPGRPTDYMSKACPVQWEGLHAKAPTWEAAYRNIFETDGMAHYFHKVLGASLLGDPLQEFFILWGDGANGKSTILETVKNALGSLAGAVSTEMVMGTRQRGGGPDPELLDLRGKRLIWTSETRRGARLNVEKVKQFTGSDTLSGRFNHQDTIIEFRPQFSLFMLTNNKPRIDDDGHGTWRRIRLIPFAFRFVDSPSKDYEKPKVKDLDEKLAQELPGILAWLVRGCLLYQEEGIGLATVPPEVMAATKDYKQGENMGLQFVEARCIRSGQVKAGQLYEAFREWYAEEFGQSAKIPGRAILKRSLITEFEYDDSGRHTYYIGISLKDD